MTFASFLAAVLFIAVAMSTIMQLATRIERRTGNSGWIDVVWTFGLGATGMLGALLPFGTGPLGRRFFVAALVAVWAFRLGLHIAGRAKGISDDPRYARMKRDWGPQAPAKMARLLQLQALASVPLASGVVLAAHNPAALGQPQDALGLAIFIVGILGGAIADRQLRGFAQSGLGGVCDTGLWALSRHPNYFFESVLWCAYAVIASAIAYPIGWLAWLAPASITLLLVRVSGIPPLEEHMLAKHGDAYRDYQQRTSAFIPLPPKGATP